MENVLSAQVLASMNARFAVLNFGHYALPVHFRVRGPVVDCQVPIWAGSSELLKTRADVTLVVAQEAGPDLLWLFARGSAALQPDPDWEGFSDLRNDRARLNDLYELVRIDPKRLELFDERRGWGFRETVDL